MVRSVFRFLLGVGRIRRRERFSFTKGVVRVLANEREL